jgi:UDP-N-acetylmuramyl tripeptide synthase
MVDFAHNPDALNNILEMAAEQTTGRRILVFGCEGEKDRLKRPLMGEIAVINAEIPILTSDNVYHEDLEQIFASGWLGKTLTESPLVKAHFEAVWAEPMKVPAVVRNKVVSSAKK